MKAGDAAGSFLCIRVFHFLEHSLYFKVVLSADRKGRSMSELARPYIPGESTIPHMPLGRYLPPLRTGMVAAWLQQEVPAGAWVLDPFGATPLLALEAAQNGYRVLVCSNNPVLSFLLETLAAAPGKAEYQSALSALATARRGDEFLERQVQALYQTRCAACSALIQPQAFLWQRDASEPYARLYHCPNCGAEGEFPVTEDDLQRLARLGGAPLARARAVDRVSLDDPEQRQAIEEALRTYPTRPLYVLFTLLNKLEGLHLPPEKLRLLHALLLTVCDEANTLWPHPSGRSRPRQLTIPPQFRENNLWLALEAAVDTWSRFDVRTPLALWPDVPPESGGICLFPGRARSLPPLPEALTPQAIVTVFPRPNQAFWTLAAIWSGWLWGRERVTPLKSALDRLRYDWYWHANALDKVLSHLAKHLPVGTRMFGIAPEVQSGLLLSILAAARTAGFQILNMALRTDSETAQFAWMSGAPPRSLAKPADWNPRFEETVRRHLSQRGEPANHLTLFTAGLLTLVEQHALPLTMEGVRTELLGHLHNSINVVLRNRSLFRHYPGATRSAEGGLWWLEDDGGDAAMPLSDRVEMEVVRRLQKSPHCRARDLDQAICEKFTGLLTPPRELVYQCLESYAEPVDAGGITWQLRENESPEQRRVDLENTARLLTLTGERMGLEVSGENPLLWQKDGRTLFAFYLMASSVVGRFLFSPQPPADQRVFVLPGSRSKLLAFKLSRDPRMAEAAAAWRFLKFRHLRRLAERTYLTIEIWNELLDHDQPSGEDAVQMRMF